MKRTNTLLNLEGLEVKPRRPGSELHPRLMDVKEEGPGRFRCQLCQKIYPETSEYFTPFPRNANKLDHRCRNCRREMDRERYVANKQRTDCCWHCGKDLYRNRMCFTCWSRRTFYHIKARIDGRHPYKGRKYIGMQLSFSSDDFVSWCVRNPPPENMSKPSVDRVDGGIGYVLSNIQWMETRQNARKNNKDVPLDKQRCSKCNEVYPFTAEFFRKNSSTFTGLMNRCKNCRR